MSDLISRIISHLGDYGNEEMDYYRGTPYEHCIKECVSKAIEIVKHVGVSDDVCEWKQGKGGTGLKRYKASCCDKSLDMPLKTAMDLKYCPYCGNKIKVVEQ